MFFQSLEHQPRTWRQQFEVRNSRMRRTSWKTKRIGKITHEHWKYHCEHWQGHCQEYSPMWEWEIENIGKTIHETLWTLWNRMGGNFTPQRERAPRQRERVIIWYSIDIKIQEHIKNTNFISIISSMSQVFLCASSNQLLVVLRSKLYNMCLIERSCFLF